MGSAAGAQHGTADVIVGGEYTRIITGTDVKVSPSPSSNDAATETVPLGDLRNSGASAMTVRLPPEASSRESVPRTSFCSPVPSCVSRSTIPSDV